MEQFAGILAKQTSPVVGGQAVNLWAVWCMGEYPQLQAMAPFLSRDCDLLGDQNTLVNLAQLTGAKATKTKAGSPTPVIGFLVAKDGGGGELLFEVLHSVKGLTPNEAKKGVLVVELDGKQIHTFSPILLLKAKIANACGLPQAGRQDVRHIKILVCCVAAYITDASRSYRRGRLSERGLVNILKECLKIVSTRDARKVEAAHGIDLSECFPESLRKLGSPKVDRFYQHQMDN